jgi:hypothetical protein
MLIVCNMYCLAIKNETKCLKIYQNNLTFQNVFILFNKFYPTTVVRIFHLMFRYWRINLNYSSLSFDLFCGCLKISVRSWSMMYSSCTFKFHDSYLWHRVYKGSINIWCPCNDLDLYRNYANFRLHLYNCLEVRYTF